jgi:pimeloyl-ACP methyl ester carboxylesterase
MNSAVRLFVSAALRTPDERFTGLPGWPYEPFYREFAGLRVHHVDEGPRDAAVTALCLHGNPAWGYLYRHMIPVFTGAGLRVVVPDLIGFGRSDKPVDPAAHTWALHLGRLHELVEGLDLRNVMLVCQDWGGLFGLTLPPAMPERFIRLLVMNTGLGTGQVTDGFRQWRDYSNGQPDLPVGKLIARGKPELSAAEVAAYDAPFPDAAHKAALKAFPNLVPDVALHGEQADGLEVSRQALAFWRDQWAGHSFMAIGMRDPVLGPAAMQSLHRVIRGCPPPMHVPEAGHFVQEWGAPIAAAALASFGLGR